MRNNISRRRGTSIAAAALSFALVAPLAQTVAAPQSAAAAHAEETAEATNGNASSLENNWLDQNNADPKNNPGDPDAEGYAPGERPNGWRHVYWENGGNKGVTQPKPVEGKPGVYNVDAIASGQITNGIQLSNFAGQGKDVVSGRAVIVTPRQGGQLTATYSGFKPVPSTVPVYFQWIDSDGSRSPIYQTATHQLDGPVGASGQGMYAFAVPQWIDAAGKKHRFVAAGKQKYRVWADAAPHDYGDEGNPGSPNNKNDRGTLNELVPVRTSGSGFPGAFGKASGEALGEFPANAGTQGNIQRTSVFFYERPYEKIAGQPINNYMKAAKQDESIPLTADMVVKAPASKLLQDTHGAIKDPGTHRDPIWNRTVSGRVWHESGNNNQLFNVGDSVGDAGAPGYRVFATSLTPEGAKAYDTEVDSLDPWNRAEQAKTWIKANPQYIAGTVWGVTDDEGRYTLRFPDSLFPGTGKKYATGNGVADQFQNHLYVWVEDKDGNVVGAPTNYSQPEFMNPNRNSQWNPTANPAVLNSFGHARIYNMNFALVNDPDLELDITNFNNTQNPAKRGEVAKLKITGDDELPVGAHVVWRDADGKPLKRCEIESKTDLRDKANPQKDCAEFDVPKDAQHGQYYYAALTNGSGDRARDIAIDSFIVLVDGPSWEDYMAAPNKQDELTLPNIGKKDPASFPQNAVYQIFDKNENKIVDTSDLTVDPNDYPVSALVDPSNGNLIFDPKSSSTAPGEKYTVKVYEQEFQKDPNNPTQDYIDPNTGQKVPTERRFIDDATIIYKEMSKDYRPEYPTYVYALGSGTPGRATVKPKFFDEKTGVQISQTDMDSKLAARGEGESKPSKAFVATLPTGWQSKYRERDVDNPGDIALDSWGTSGHQGDRGNFTFRPPAGAKAGDQYDLPIRVNYADGTSDDTVAKIRIVGTVADVYGVEYDEVTVKPGGENAILDPILTDVDGNPIPALPAGTKYEIDPTWTRPDGYKVDIDQANGKITVTPPAGVKDTTEKDFRVPVIVTYPKLDINGTTLPAGSQDEATARVLLDTDGDGIADVRDVTVFPPEQTKAEGKPIDAIEITPGDPNATIKVPELPEGLQLDQSTKTITGTPEIDWQPNEDERTIPVVVTVENEDGTSASETAFVTVIRNQSKDAIRVHAVPNIEVPVDREITPIPVRVTSASDAAAEIQDANVEVFWYDETGAPAEKITGLDFDETEQAITGTPTVAGEVRNILIRATRGDQVDQTYLKITVTNEMVISLDADTDGDTLTNGDEIKGSKNPYGTPTENADGTLTSNLNKDPETNGAPTDPFQADTDGDGINDGDEVNRVDDNGNPAPTDPNNPDTDGDGVNDGDEKKWGTDPTDANSVPPTIVPGTVVDTVIKGEDKVLDDTVKNATSDTKATVVDGNGNPIDGATATIGDGGKITVNVPTDKPEGPAQVVITHPGADGKPQEVGRIDIVVVRPGTRAVEFTPSYDAAQLKPGTETTVNPTWKDDKQPKEALESAAGEKSAGADDWTITTDKTGKVTAKAPTNDQVKAEYKRLFPNGAGTWEAFVAGFTNYARPTETVTFTYDDGSQNIAKANFDLVGQDGKSILDPQGDFDGDGVKNKDEIEQNSNPFDENSKSGVKPGSLIDDVKAGDPEGTKLDDVVTNPTKDMTGIVRDKDGNVIDGATVTVTPSVDGKTGEITVSVPENATPGIGSVQITDQNGNPVGNPIVINIVAPDPSIVPGNKKDEITAGTDTKLDDEVKNPTTGMTGEVRDDKNNVIPDATVTVNPETGEITVNVPKDSGYEGPATVIIKDKNGKQVGEPIEVTVKQPATEASQFAPEYKDATQVRVDGRANTANPFGDTTAPVQKVNPSDVRDWTFSPVGNSGVIDVKAPTTEQVIAEFNRVFPDGLQGATTEDKLKALQDGLNGYANPTTEVEFIYTDGSKDTAKAKLELLDKNGVNILDPKGDLDGDGVDNKTELENNSNPADPNSKPVEKQPEAPKTTVVGNTPKTVQPTNKQQDTGIKVTNPDKDTKVEAKDEDDKTIPVFIDNEGKVQVVPGTDVDGPITVTITDPDLVTPENPEGKVTITVPVEGHAAGEDDNAIVPGANDKDPIPADGKPHKIDDKVANPTTGMTGEVRDDKNNVIPGATVTVDPTTGEITVTVPEGTQLGDATVQIIGKDGKPVGKPIDVEITKPAPTLDNKNTVDDVVAGKPGGTQLDDKVLNPTDGMGGKVTDKDGKEIEGSKVTVNPTTGEITVKVPEGTKPGIGKVEITDRDGKKIGETIINITEKPAAPKDPSVTDGTEGNQQVPADGNGHKLDDKVQNPTEGMTGTVTDKNGNPIDGATATVDPNTGEITVTVPKGTEPGEATVTIKDKDGNEVGKIDITITNQAGEFEPTYTDTKVPAGQSVNTNDPFEGKNAPVAKVDVAKQDAAKDWTFNPVGKSGVINATAPTNEQISAAIKTTFPEGYTGDTDDAKWNNFTEKFKGYAQPEVGVTVTYTDDSTDGAKANFDLVGKDGKSLLDPDGDFDGDGVSNKEEIVRGLDPANSDTDGDGISDGKEIKNGTNPLKVDNFSGNINVDGPVNGTVGKEITPIDVKGEGEGVTVEIKDGKLPDGLKFENGKITGTPTKAGTFKTTVVSKDANGRVLKEREITFVITEAGAKGTNTTATATATATTTARQTTVIEPKCIAASVGLGIPLIALIPIGLATQIAIPGLTPVVEQVSLQIERANANIQQQIGIFNPETAVQVAEINARLRAFGLDLATVGAGLALLAAGILSGTIIYEACGPEDSKLMSSDMKLEGSSGKVYKPRETTGKLTTSKAAPTTTATPTPTPTK